LGQKGYQPYYQDVLAISSGLFILYGEFSILTVIYTKVSMKKGLQVGLE
jgi:hypothetical protein